MYLVTCIKILVSILKVEHRSYLCELLFFKVKFQEEAVSETKSVFREVHFKSLQKKCAYLHLILVYILDQNEYLDFLFVIVPPIHLRHVE